MYVTLPDELFDPPDDVELDVEEEAPDDEPPDDAELDEVDPESAPPVQPTKIAIPPTKPHANRMKRA